jgi:hypothetical protein
MPPKKVPAKDKKEKATLKVQVHQSEVESEEEDRKASLASKVKRASKRARSSSKRYQDEDFITPTKRYVENFLKNFIILKPETW